MMNRWIRRIAMLDIALAVAATITPPALVTVTEGPLQSPLATPTMEASKTPAP